MDDIPRTLRAMLAEAKDTSELMVDLAYASVYFDDPHMAEEVDELEQDKLPATQRVPVYLVPEVYLRGKHEEYGAAEASD